MEKKPIFYSDELVGRPVQYFRGGVEFHDRVPAAGIITQINEKGQATIRVFVNTPAGFVTKKNVEFVDYAKDGKDYFELIKL